MSHFTLKEQLQALSLGTSTTAVPEKNKRSKTKFTEKIKQKPVWLEHAQYGVELLKAYFPNCFKELKDIKPLKIGIKQDLVKLLSTRGDIVLSDKACMVSSLAYYVGSVVYHKAMLEGAVRIDLDGQPTGAVTLDEANYSKECLETKLKKKNKVAMVKEE